MARKTHDDNQAGDEPQDPRPKYRKMPADPAKWTPADDQWVMRRLGTALGPTPEHWPDRVVEYVLGMVAARRKPWAPPNVPEQEAQRMSPLPSLQAEKAWTDPRGRF